MTTLKQLRENRSMTCKCGSNSTHLEFDHTNKTKDGRPRTFRVCDECGHKQNLTTIANKVKK